MCIRSNNSTSSSRWLQRDKNCNLKYLLVKVVSSKTIIYHINYLSCQTFHIFKNFYLFKVEIFWLPRAWLSQENGPNKVSFSNTKDCMYMPNLKIQIKNCSKQSDRYFWHAIDTQITEDSTSSGLDLRMTTSHTINSNTQGTMEISKTATSDLPSSSISLGLNKDSTTTAQISGTSIDQNSNAAPSTTHFSSPQYERTGNTIQTYNSDKVPPHPTSKQMPSQKRTSSHTDIVSPKPSGEISKLPSQSNKCKSCTCVNITNHLTLNNVNISLIEIRSKLLLPQKNLSSYVRQKRSADDDRRSAADMGYVGLAIIIACVSWVVSSDVVHMLYIIKCVMARQLCQASKKEQRK